nr:immunoglobulin heavy chain junction region [Macaca mulatta]MOV87988.1 immunoglobulin heavy chain junction region [Macaca mulatta]MOV89580.1 immunoglobulin heavy chain junction region [Macaca mulatta]MOV89880.1 immunoglobulin heavy chain junction region [Macaca mulatta]MOV90961.1 immunoglobulin heavy chain junction region [Macaca mulatta]
CVRAKSMFGLAHGYDYW